MSHRDRPAKIRSTTVLSVRRDGLVAVGGDGQVSVGNTRIKQDANKIRSLADGAVLCGFAGATADAFALFERFETHLNQYPGNLRRAAIELTKQWRMDRALRQLRALLIAASPETTLMIGGSGDVVEPSDGVVGIGSGGMYAVASARALLTHTSLPADRIVTESLKIAADICVFTNDRIIVESLKGRSP